jgi:hypothetical protein
MTGEAVSNVFSFDFCLQGRAPYLAKLVYSYRLIVAYGR